MISPASESEVLKAEFQISTFLRWHLLADTLCHKLYCNCKDTCIASHYYDNLANGVTNPLINRFLMENASSASSRLKLGSFSFPLLKVPAEVYILRASLNMKAVVGLCVSEKELNICEVNICPFMWISCVDSYQKSKPLV